MTIIGLLLIGSNLLVKAQTERFVEVEVSDTIMLKPTSFVFEINSNPANYPLEEMMEAMEELDGDYNTNQNYNGLVSMSIVDIMVALKKEKFPYTIETITASSLYSGKRDTVLTVELLGKNEFERFQDFLSSHEDISGNIAEVKYESLAKYNKGMYENLYAKALEEAKVIAAITGGSIGEVISVSDKKSASSSWMDLYGDIMNESLYGLYGKKRTNDKREIVSKVFRFQLK